MPSGSNKTLPIVLLMTAMFSAMGGPTIAPALPAIKAAYADIPNIEFWTKCLVTFNGLFAAVGAPLFGWLSDRIGRRKALFTAVLLWGIFGSAGLFPQPFWTLLLARSLLGLSLGGLLAANSVMIADSFKSTQQRKMMGFQSSFASIGVIVGLVSSGFLADLHWRFSFAVFLCAFPVLPLLLWIPEPIKTTPSNQIDSKLTRSSRQGLTLICFFGFFAMLCFTVLPSQLPFYMRTHGIGTSGRLGLLLALLPLSSAIGGRIYFRISTFFKTWNFFLLAAFMMLSGFYGFNFFPHTTGFVVSMVLIGAGYGFAMPHTNMVLASIVPSEKRGRAMGILTGSKFGGQFFSPILLQPILASGGYKMMLHVSGWAMMVIGVIVWRSGLWIFGEEKSNR